MGSSLRCFLWFLEISRVLALLLSDVAINNQEHPTTLSLFIKCSKTDQFHQGTNIYLSKTDTDLCPVAEYLTLRQQPDGPGSSGAKPSRSEPRQSLRSFRINDSSGSTIPPLKHWVDGPFKLTSRYILQRSQNRS